MSEYVVLDQDSPAVRFSIPGTTRHDGVTAKLLRLDHSSWTDHTLPPGGVLDLLGPDEAILARRAAVPDFTLTRKEAVAGKDELTVHGRFIGTHTALFGQFPSSGGAIDFTVVDLHRLEDGRIEGRCQLEDNRTVLTQMGAMPPLAG